MVILHGLLGSSRNWNTAARSLTPEFEVFALDLRNHGDSPRVPRHTYVHMMNDVVAWLDRQSIDRAVVLGHSMGGKVAMLAACRFPDRVQELYVADISPKAYQPHYDAYLRAMQAINVEQVDSREEAERFLESAVSSWGMRKFLLTNLVRDDSGSGFRWQVNLEALLDDYEDIIGNPLKADDLFGGPAVFIRGGNSPFIEDTDKAVIERHFPRAQLVTLADAGHNLHVEQRETFVETVLKMRAYFREQNQGGGVQI